MPTQQRNKTPRNEMKKDGEYVNDLEIIKLSAYPDSYFILESW